MKKIALLVMFTCLMIQSSLSYATGQTGELKIYSENQGVSIYVDNELKGTDSVSINSINAGTHYIKALKGDTVVYSNVVDVAQGKTSTVLIKILAETADKASDNLYAQKLEYKNKKIEVLIKSSLISESSSVGSGTAWGGYSSVSGIGWGTSQSSLKEVSDWIIVKGGLEKLSEVGFLETVNDEKAATVKNDLSNEYLAYNLYGWLAIGGFALAVVQGGSPVAGTIICLYGWGSAYTSYKAWDGHHITPTYAAEKADNYNLKVKKELKLPVDYEPK